uniref:Chitin-binding type-2 domain-containing protein n=1 Tax=Heligmosomoides polygyrus TaxID=6339 RepID=A0A183FTS6_HELPZ
LGSCVIERYDHKHRQLQWAYCNPKREFYCATLVLEQCSLH